MAEPRPPRAELHAIPRAAEVDDALRLLKTRLQARFPAIKSSHLTEAIASSLGFKTNAALRASPRPTSSLLVLKSFEPESFRNRLTDFGYEVQPDFQLGAPATSPQPPEHYLAWLRELRELEKAPDQAWPRIHVLRKTCAGEFAKAFGLGRLEDRDDKTVVRHWNAGVDHNASLPNWGAKVNSMRGASINFPGTDHRRRFRQAMPLSNGKVVEYESAIVSMPYVGADGIPREHEAASKMAGRLGWTCDIHTEWSWYAIGSTALVLFKRSTPHGAMLSSWEHSFQRWVVENRTRLLKSAGATRRKVIEDIVDDQNLPLDVADFEDCRERYLKEFALHLYEEHNRGMGLIFKRLMGMWAQER